MRSVIDKTKKGFTISFQTRGVDMKVATEIWNDLNPTKLEELTAWTGHSFLVWKEGYCAEIHKTDWGNYTIWCGKTFDEEQTDEPQS